MIGREWAPGDVAATEYRGVESLAMVVTGRVCSSLTHPRTPHWHGMSGGWNPLDDMEVEFRPLVTLDPESREDVERLAREFFEAGLAMGGGIRWDDMAPWEQERRVDAMQEALREFANPKAREVFEHYTLSANSAPSSPLFKAACGKLWTPDESVTVVGKCPTCEEIVSKGWVA